MPIFADLESLFLACDPNSKQYGKQNKDTKYDEPPEIFEKKTKKIKDDSDAKWEDEEKRERMLQREALRDLRQTTAKVYANGWVVTKKVCLSERCDCFVYNRML